MKPEKANEATRGARLVGSLRPGPGASIHAPVVHSLRDSILEARLFRRIRAGQAAQGRVAPSVGVRRALRPSLAFPLPSPPPLSVGLVVAPGPAVRLPSKTCAKRRTGHDAECFRSVAQHTATCLYHPLEVVP